MNKKIMICILATAVISVFMGAGCGETTTPQDSGNQQVLGGATTSAPSVTMAPAEANKKLLELAITTGPKDSTATIIEASDFECPACRSIQPEFAQTIEKYRDRVQFGYVPFPLSYHKNAMPAALTVAAAQLQGKGWEMYERFFEGSSFDVSKIDQVAKDLNLDMDKFNSDKDSAEIKAKVDQSIQLLESLNLQGTPTFYINGVEFTGRPSFVGFESEIKKLLNIQ